MFLLSSWYDMDVRVELLADDVWVSEDDKTGFLGVEVDSFERLFLRPISFPMVQIGKKNKKMRNKDKRESSTNWNMTFFNEWSKYYVWLYPLMKKIEKSKNIKQSVLMNVHNNIFW